MFRRKLLLVALVLATPALNAQTARPAPQTRTPDRTVPAIMHERMITLSGCVQRSPDWVLAGAALTGQKETASYKIEGIGEARLLVLVGKKVDATGVILDAGKPAAAGAAQPLPRFEATAIREVAATCS